MSNSKFCTAKLQKNDEFYTLTSDVEKELRHYTDLLKGKTILCNCNDGEDSAFWRYLSANFTALGLKRLIAVKYCAAACGYVLEMERVNGILLSRKKYLHGNGDFRSEESIEYLCQADIVITNPPFSLFREYIYLLTEMDKKYLLIGNMNAITYSEVFPYIQNNKMWLGHGFVRDFLLPNGEGCVLSFVLWYTNLKDTTSDRGVILSAKFDPVKYTVFDNYKSINIDRIADIPFDYYGIMGVPISYITKHNSEQFEIVGITGRRKYPNCISPKKVYLNPVEHRENGSVCYGGKVNDAATILLHNKPENKVYYTADNADGYLICKYVRVLIRRKTA